MKVLIGCDVDPILPRELRHPLGGGIWNCLDKVEQLIDAARGSLPPMTWLIRADESVRFATGDFASGYASRRRLWRKLADSGHELGWHMHLMSFDAESGRFVFDRNPKWLADAWQALSTHYHVQSTRTGWDYGSNALFAALEAFDILVDFSALPGALAWHSVASDRIKIDWSRCPNVPYHPSADDYQRPGHMKLLEIPVTQFRRSAAEVVRSIAGRLLHGNLAMSGIRNKTRKMSDPWIAEFAAEESILTFYFHPEDLVGGGVDNFVRNLEALRSLPDVEFVTACGARRFLAGSAQRGQPNGLADVR